MIINGVTIFRELGKDQVSFDIDISILKYWYRYPEIAISLIYIPKHWANKNKKLENIPSKYC